MYVVARLTHSVEKASDEERLVNILLINVKNVSISVSKNRLLKKMNSMRADRDLIK